MQPMNPQKNSKLPVGVFDSGMGGLTVLRELKQLLPQEDFVYLGDTARLPYGTKSQATVSRYALQVAQKLVQVGVKAIVVACNTASATALPVLKSQFPDMPIYGVVEPGAAAAAENGSGEVALLATESTVQGGAYQRALLTYGVRKIRARSAPLLVALAEEGEPARPLREAVLQHYIRGLVTPDVQTLLLGCTHFPVFAETLGAVLDRDVQIVDSARTTAEAVARTVIVNPRQEKGDTLYMATDGLERFRRVGEVFLGTSIGDVELIDV